MCGCGFAGLYAWANGWGKDDDRRVGGTDDVGGRELLRLLAFG